MFDKLIENLLQDVLGDYIEGLDKQGLKVGLWSGVASAQNLKLKENCIIKMGFPFRIKLSKLTSLNVNIPWKSLSTSPIRIQLDELIIVAEPLREQDWQFDKLTPQQVLEMIETFKQSVNKKIAEKVEVQKEGMVGRIIMRVIENLQIHITKIHIRVEDSVTVKHSSFGIILAQFRMVTVNEEGNEQFIDRATSDQRLIKQMDIIDCGIYWNTESIHNLELEELIKYVQLEYVLIFTLTAKLIQPPPKVYNQPKYYLDFNLKHIKATLAKSQIQQLFHFLDYYWAYKNLQNQQATQITKEPPKGAVDALLQLLALVPLDKRCDKQLNAAQLKQVHEILKEVTFEQVKTQLIALYKEQQLKEMLRDAQIKKQPAKGIFSFFSKKEVLALSPEEENQIKEYLDANFKEEVFEEQTFKILYKVDAVIMEGQFDLKNTTNNPLKSSFKRLSYTLPQLVTQANIKQIKLEFEMFDPSPKKVNFPFTQEETPVYCLEPQQVDMGIVLNIQYITFFFAKDSETETILALTGTYDFSYIQFKALTLPELMQEQEFYSNEQELFQQKNYCFTLSLHMDHLQAFICSKQEVEKKIEFESMKRRQIIKPVSAMLSVKKQLLLENTYLVNTMTIHGNLQKCYLKVAFRDLQYINTIIQQQLSFINWSQQTDELIQRYNALPVPLGYKYSQLTIAFNLEEFQIISLNDLDKNQQYLIDYCVNNTMIEFESGETMMQFNSVIPISLRYFNSQIQIWEPLIEPIAVKVKYWCSDIETKYEIEVRQNINLNVSTMMIKTVYQSLDLLKAKIGESDNEQNIQQYYKYAIHNQTGCLLVVNEVNIINNMEIYSFDTDKNQIVVWVEGPGQQYEIVVCLTKGIQRSHPLFNTCLLQQNTINHNQQMIILTTNLILRNQTNFPLYIQLMDTQDHFENSILDQTMVVPMRYLKGRLTILWEENPVAIKLDQIRKPTEVILDVKKDARLRVVIMKDPIINGRLFINIQPLFQIMNLLPLNINYRILSENFRTDERNLISLNHQNEYFYHRKCLIQIFIDSYEASSMIELLFNRESQQFTIKGEQWNGSNGGDTLFTFDIDKKEYSETGLYRFVLYHPVYLRNETPFELVVFQGKKYFQTLGGQKNGTRFRPIFLKDTTENPNIMFSDRKTPQVLPQYSASISTVGVSQCEFFYKLDNQPSSQFRLVLLSVSTKVKLIQSTIQKVITVRPRLLLINETPSWVYIQQQYGIQELNPNQRAPLEVFCSDKLDSMNFIVKMTVMGDWKYSGNLDLNSVGVLNLQLKNRQDPTIRKFYQIDITQEHGCLFAVIREPTKEQIPFKITNRSKMISIDVLNIPQRLLDGYQCEFAWDEPCDVNKQVKLILNPFEKGFKPLEYLLNIDKVVKNVMIKIVNERTFQNFQIKLNVKIEGYQKHAIFSDVNSKHEQQNLQPQLTVFDLKMQTLIISMIDNSVPRPFECVCISMQTIQVILQKNDKLIFQLKIKSLQLDNNCKMYPPFPIVLTSYQNQLPILNCLLEMDLNAKQVQLIDRITFDLNPISLKIDILFVQQLVGFINKIMDIMWYQEAITDEFKWQTFILPAKPVPTYINQIIIAPLQMELTLLLKLDKTDDQIMKTLASMGMGLVNLQDVEIKMQGIRLDNCFDTIYGLYCKIFDHYVSQAKDQFAFLFFSIAIIGNPVSLFKNVASGFIDFVEKPIEGFTKGPIEGSMGIIDGTKSLVTHTISGTMNTVSSITGAVTSGLAQITFDDEYIEQRQIDKQTKSQNLPTGIADGSKQVAMGFFNGITGLVTKPIQGAQQDGATGFIKGLWKGASGLVIKPASGIIDAVTKTAEGMKNQFSDNKSIIKRARPMRPFYTSDGFYSDYDDSDAQAYELLNSIKKGALSEDYFVKSFSFKKDNCKYVIIISSETWILYDLSHNNKIWVTKIEQIRDVSFQYEIMIKIQTSKSKKSYGVYIYNMKNKSIVYIEAKGLKPAFDQMRSTLQEWREKSH